MGLLSAHENKLGTISSFPEHNARPRAGGRLQKRKGELAGIERLLRECLAIPVLEASRRSAKA